MADTSGRQARIGALSQLSDALDAAPVVASVVGRGPIEEYLGSQCRAAVVASLELRELDEVVAGLRADGRFFFLNIDSCRGLAQDKGALEYLISLGVPGIVSTRTALVERAKALGQVAMQKVFVTDRSNLPRSVTSTSMSKPDLHELMPWPVVPRVDQAIRRELSPFLAAGFVQREADVSLALALGARAAATSDPALWNADPGELRSAAHRVRAQWREGRG